jgi:hypothetical protein
MACIEGGRSYFIKPNETIKDLAGKVVQVTKEEMDEIERQGAAAKENYGKNAPPAA